ncbi:MAG: GGDEF domain-containing protein [Pirellulaceae bacterium]
MDEWINGIPGPVAMAIVAVIGYFVGKRSPRETTAAANQARRELKRAKAVIHQLEEISRDIRRNLSTHQTSIMHFKERIGSLSQDNSVSGESWQSICDEAEQMLTPTMRLSAQIAHAYDEIRQQANLLMTFTESRTDPLTGLSNRRALDDCLDSLFAMNNRYKLEFTLCILDVDHFKKVNDENGHLHGDRILQEVSSLIDSCVRETDIVTRYGGEEFVVVMPQTPLKGACVFAERVRTSVEAQLGITVSGGLAQVAVGDDPKTLLGRADSALYHAKAKGRNQICCHTGEKIVDTKTIQDEPISPAREKPEKLLTEIRDLEQSLHDRSGQAPRLEAVSESRVGD